jgi:predicted regulator of Ras-like GTPase activity (Roadblock/LC7/MglB family)
MAVVKSRKKMEKTMQAKSTALLKHLMGMELRRFRKEAEVDMLMFIGVDGRIFASEIPPQLSSHQYYLLNLVKTNLHAMCSQLKSENLKISVQQYKEGLVMNAGVGENAFLVAIISKNLEIEQMSSYIKSISNAAAVLKHIFELKPITDEVLAKYPDEIANELKKLRRQLFVERFDTTREYKKNMEILNYINKKLAEVVGVGAVDEIVTVMFNELGTSAPYMTDRNWLLFVEKVIKEHIQTMRGDIIADECYKTWMPAIQKKLKSFV